MRFIHTADWQIGMKASHAGAAAQKVRDQRLTSARKVIQLAVEKKADFVLVAGDIFEDNAVDRILIQKVADILGSFGGPVYVIPGNHDPYCPGSVWEHPSWKSFPDVHLLLEEEPLGVTDGTLFPCPAKEKSSNGNPTKWIDAANSVGIAIGLAHGTLEGIQQDEPDYPVPRDAPTQTALDYLALGHWHSTATYTDSAGSVRMAYSGTHEQTKFGERDSGNVLLVEIDKRNGSPKITPIHSGELEWIQISEKVVQTGDLVRLRTRIESLTHPESKLLELSLSGLAALTELQEIRRIEEIIQSRFLFGRSQCFVCPYPGDESWIGNLPVGVLREAAKLLLSLADPGYEGDRPDGCSTQAASMALLELYSLAEEAKG